MIRFYGYFKSSSSYRCRIAFGLKGVATEFRPVHLVRGGGQQKSAEYRRLNPQGLVPALEIDGQVLTQSPAILEWLEETYPEPPLLPSSAIERAQVRAFCAAIACEIHPLQNLRVQTYIRDVHNCDQAAIDAWCAKWIGDGLAACENLLRYRPKSKFAFSDTPGMAEVYLVPQLFSARRFGVDLGSLPRLTEIGELAEGIPAFADAHPSRQPDAE